MIDLLKLENRTSIIDEIKGYENLFRKRISYEQVEIYNDRIKQSVLKFLLGFYSKKTIDNTPIISSINLAKRIVNKEASIYNKEPKRTFLNVTDQQAEFLTNLYYDIGVNTMMNRLNKYYKLQDQAHLYVTIKNGKLKLRPLMPHDVDAIPSIDDQEQSDCYIISGFDRQIVQDQISDGINEKIADWDDYKSNLNVFAVWSKDYNFIMNENGSVTSGDMVNPIGIVPIVEVANDKDGEYWVRTGHSLTDFTTQFNGTLTDIGNIVRMQGFGQAWLKAPQNLMPDNIQVGANFIIRLPIDPNNPTQTDFGFANANPDLSGSLTYVEGLLSSFLTSRGIDPRIVNSKGSSSNYASGLERLLAMVEQFEASERDFDSFEKAENELLQIIIRYVNTFSGTQLLPNIPKIVIPLDAQVSVQYQKPSSMITETEKLDVIQRKLEMGLISQVEAIAIDREISQSDAEEVFSKINGDQFNNNKQAQNIKQQDANIVNDLING